MSLKEARNDLAAHMNEGVTAPVYPFMPESLKTPSVSLVSGSPYVSPPPAGDNRFCAGEYIVNVTAICVVAVGGNKNIVDSMDDLLEETISSVSGSAFSVEDAGAYYPLTVGNAQFLACDVNLTTLVTF